jgi:hypothetical protein
MVILAGAESLLQVRQAILFLFMKAFNKEPIQINNQMVYVRALNKYSEHLLLNGCGEKRPLVLAPGIMGLNAADTEHFIYIDFGSCRISGWRDLVGRALARRGGGNAGQSQRPLA